MIKLTLFLKVPEEYADIRDMQERRSETRLLCADVIEVSWKDGGKKHQAIGLLEDISKSGACLQMEYPIAIGSEIVWISPEKRFAGIVRYCVYREIGYFVGVQFSDGIQWSEESFEPLHLLDIEKLAKVKPSRASGLTIQ